MKKFRLYLSIFVLLVLNTIPSLFLPKLPFNNAPEVYLSKDQPAVILERALRKQFPDDQVAMILFGGSDLYENNFLEKLEAATQAIARIEDIDRVVNVTEIEHINATEDGFEVTPLLGSHARKTIKSASARHDYAKQDTVAYGAIVSDRPDYQGIIVRPYQLSSTLERIAILEQVHRILQQYQIDQKIVATAGPIPLEIAQFESMLRDTMIFVPATVIIGLILIWFMFRRLLAVIIASLVTGAVVNSAVMLYVIFNIPYTLVSSMIPPLLSALTTAFMIHFYTNMQLASSFSYIGFQRVSFALKQIYKPAFFTAFTTVVGLSSLGVSPIPPISHFGLVAAAGVVFLFLIVMYIVPPLFEKFDKVSWPNANKNNSVLKRFLKALIHLSVRKPLWVVAVMLFIILAGLPWIFQVKVETNMLKFFKDDHSITQGTRLIEKNLNGVMPLEVDLFGPERDIFKKYQALEQIQQLQSWLKQQPEVDKVTTVVDVIKDMHQAFHQDEPNNRIIPDNNPLISQYLFVYDGEDIYEVVNREFDQTRIVISMNVHNSKQIRQFINRIADYLDSHLKQVKWDIGGDGRIFADQDKLLIQGQINSLFIAIILIFMIMLLIWRNLGFAVLSMIPNLSPIIGIFILMGLLGIWLDMATAMIASVSIGIAVDDTIHMLHGFKKRIDKGVSTVFALVQSYYKTGRAIIVTTVILCAQFFLLAFSEFVPTAHFGLLTAMGLLMALFFDLLLLPALIILFYQKRQTY